MQVLKLQRGSRRYRRRPWRVAKWSTTLLRLAAPAKHLVFEGFHTWFSKLEYKTLNSKLVIFDFLKIWKSIFPDCLKNTKWASRRCCRRLRAVGKWSTASLQPLKHEEMQNLIFKNNDFRFLKNQIFMSFVYQHRTVWSAPTVPTASSVLQNTHPLAENSSEVKFESFVISDFSIFGDSQKSLSVSWVLATFSDIHVAEWDQKWNLLSFQQVGVLHLPKTFFRLEKACFIVENAGTQIWCILHLNVTLFQWIWGKSWYKGID